MMNAMSTLIDVPKGLNGVAVTDTTIGDVDGEAGFFHYRGHDATDLARHRSFEEVWHLVAVGHLPDDDEVAALRRRRRRRTAPARPRCCRCSAPLAQAAGRRCGSVRAAVSIAADELGLRPLIDLDARRARGPGAAALRRRSRRSWPPCTGPASASPPRRAAATTSVTPPTTSASSPARCPTPAAARALEQYLILTIDHGFNASTFTARVVASTGADLADVVGAALGALAGPLHGGAPGRALDALDAIGDPARTEAWVEQEVAAGRRIMGFGHAVYRTRDPRSALLREVAIGLGGDLVDLAVDVEGRVLDTLRRLKPDRPLPSNVEFFAGVVMASAGLPRGLFTPTFAVSRTIGWTTHAVEQAAEGKLIRPSARYVGR